jgi:hypothetical protein
MKRQVLYSALGVVFVVAAGCATVRLPLCPSLAHVSAPVAQSSDDVNFFVRQNAGQRRIRVAQLSTFNAEFKGATWDIKWLRTHYITMLCAFNPTKIDAYGSTYTSCMDKAPQWISLIEMGREKDLLNDPYDYVGNCVAPYHQ